MPARIPAATARIRLDARLQATTLGTALPPAATSSSVLTAQDGIGVAPGKLRSAASPSLPSLDAPVAEPTKDRAADAAQDRSRAGSALGNHGEDA